MVLLGVPEQPVYIPAEEGVTKIGGVPRWLCGEPPSLQEAKCSKCNCKLELLVSADCPISDEYDRILYFFICPKCGQEGKVYRQKQIYHESSQPDGGQLFSRNDFSNGNMETPGVAAPPAGGNDILSALSAFNTAVSTNQKQTKKQKKAQKPKQEKGRWPAYYIDTFDEPEASLEPSFRYEISKSADSTSSTLENDMEEGAGNNPGIQITPELVEYNERMSRCPEQVIRYSRFGDPLVQDKTDLSNIPKCPACGADRSFEFEIIPTIIYTLEPASEMDFGPILIYTCSADCGEVGTNEEHCIICPP